jgi:hypothetical protein
MEGNSTVLVLRCTGSGREMYCVGLGMYRDLKVKSLCWFGDVQKVEGNRNVLV